MEKKVAKVVDIGTPRCVKQRLFSSWGPGLFLRFVISSPFPFPRRDSRLSIPITRENLPHTVGSSRFGGHCTSSGGCGGVVVGGKSIFHDGVACCRSSPFLPCPPSNSLSLSSRCASVLAFVAARDYDLSSTPLQDRREHPLQDAGRSIPRRRLFVHVDHPPLSCTWQFTRAFSSTSTQRYLENI